MWPVVVEFPSLNAWALLYIVHRLGIVSPRGLLSPACASRYPNFSISFLLSSLADHLGFQSFCKLLSLELSLQKSLHFPLADFSPCIILPFSAGYISPRWALGCSLSYRKRKVSDELGLYLLCTTMQMFPYLCVCINTGEITLFPRPIETVVRVQSLTFFVFCPCALFSKLLHYFQWSCLMCYPLLRII